MLKFLALIGISFCLEACASVSASTLDYSLANIYTAIEHTLSMGIQKNSENHREFYSRPFLVTQEPDSKKEGYHDRGVAKVLVLGDSRPYTVEVEVSVERGTKGGGKKQEVEYSHDHYDKKLAKKILDGIMRRLDRRQHDENIIDDFKPF